MKDSVIALNNFIKSNKHVALSTGRRTCYYAHCVALYGTVAEKRDVRMLQRLGFKVTNPNSPEVRYMFDDYRGEHDNYMGFFEILAAGHDITAFRALPSGHIPSGVHLEVVAAQNAGKIILEIPCAITRRSLSHVETVEYLQEIGER